MSSPSAKTILAVCAILILAGGVAEAYLLPRAVPSPASRLKDSPPPSVSQARLCRCSPGSASSSIPMLRTKLADAVLTESARAELRSALRPGPGRGGEQLPAAGLERARRLRPDELKPSTFAWIAGREPDISEDSMVMEDPVVDVRLAVRYLRWLEHRFPKRDEALMAYNAGPRRMQQYKKAGIPDSLREYPRRVMKEYRRFVRMMNEPELREVVVAQAN